MPSATDSRESRPVSSGSSTPAPSSLPAFPPLEPLPLCDAQWLFAEADLAHTPSAVAGLDPRTERENRAKGVNFILQVGIMLKLPQLTLASAAVFLHRFFMRAPMVEDRVARRPHHHYYSVAAAALFLATKVEENCRKMRDLVVACVRVAQKQPAKDVDEQDKEFWRWRDTILALEDRLLEALCFDLRLEPAYAPLYAGLVRFGAGGGDRHSKALRNAAWAFVNDSCLTPLCLLWPSRTIAAAAIYAAARHVGARLPDDAAGRPWWEVMGVELKAIRRACNFMTAVYEHAPLKGGAAGGEGGGESMYQRTPEDGDEVSAKTRLRAEVKAEEPDGERRGSEGSTTSRKRGRPGNEDVKGEGSEEEPTWGGVGRADEEAAKRRKLDPEVNGEDVERGSEAGEVKEEPAWGGERPVGTESTPSRDARATGNWNGAGEGATNGVLPRQDRGIKAEEDSGGGGLISPKLEEDGSEEGELEQ